MANVNKTYLDEEGLATYDELIKETISDVEEQIPAISVDNNTLIINTSSNDD